MLALWYSQHWLISQNISGAYDNFKKRDFAAGLELSSNNHLDINDERHPLDNG